MILVPGGFLIFPLTQLLLRGMGNAYALPKRHPMNALGVQVAFTLPLTLPVVIGIAALRPAWFYPKFMITLGTHYLPFAFMYGMSQFAGLCAILVTSGVAIGMDLPTPLSLGAWLTAAILFLFELIGRHAARRYCCLNASVGSIFRLRRAGPMAASRPTIIMTSTTASRGIPTLFTWPPKSLLKIAQRPRPSAAPELSCIGGLGPRRGFLVPYGGLMLSLAAFGERWEIQVI